MKKRTIAGAAAALALGLTVSMNPVKVEAAKETWSIYWYLCGSDLESKGGAATKDIQELMSVRLPENVTVVIETGGAKKWQNSTMSSRYLERYVYDSTGLGRAERVQQANMGSSSTLADFLNFCEDYYPADHEIVLFWDHGGGSTQGVAFDENYRYDSLTLDEMYQAFDSVYDLSKGAPLEMVGFDTCLMATIDTAYTFSDIANYMVASEEYEPGCGWDYKGWVSALARDTSMDGAELGKYICDTYIKGCQKYRMDGEATLSVTDLRKVGKLQQAYNKLGAEALVNQTENASFFADFCRNAERAESYGGNSAKTGYSNMVDLGDLVRQNQYNFPKSGNSVLTALDDCIVYKVNGKYRQEASGLSCYFSFNKDEKDLRLYDTICASDAFSSFYNYCMLDEMTDQMEAYIETLNLSLEDLQQVETFETIELEEVEASVSDNIPVEITEDGYAMIQLSQETMDAIQGVYFMLAYVDEENDYIMWLGSDNNIDMDWDNGIFMDNFTGYWGCLEGHICYMEIAYEGENYNLYYVPILLNGEEYQLHVVYDYLIEEYYVLGARKGLDDNNGMADRNLVQLERGDVITTLMYGSTYYGDDEAELIEIDRFRIYDDDPLFADEYMGDGTFAMWFYMEDCRGNEVSSDIVWFTIEDGMIYTDMD